MSATNNAEAGPSHVREMRITTQGKMGNWVSAALEHLQKNEEEPLVLHTLPAAKRSVSATREEGEKEKDHESKRQGSAGKGGGMHSSMATIPRLVSVVEIIKREYLKSVDAGQAEGGTLYGLHQYNEIGDLEEGGYLEESGSTEEERASSLVRSLQGRKHLQQKKIAFMRVTLSRNPLPALQSRGATYQQPSVRRLTKSTRARLKKKKAREELAGVDTGDK